MDTDTYTDKKVIQLTGQFVPVKLNAEKDGKSVAGKYGVQGFPTILFINASGVVEGRIGGYMPPAGFSEQLQTISQAHRDFPLLLARYKKDPQDAEAAGRLAAIYAGRGEIRPAEEARANAEKGDPGNTKDYLTKAYNALGDYYQEKQDFGKAIPLFEKAAGTGKTVLDITYARLSIAVCYFAQQKTKEAIPALEAVIAMPNATKEDKAQAQQMLDAAKKRGQH